MKKSFTLIEVLVTIFLLSLLLATAMFSFKLFIKNLDSIQVTLPKKAMAYKWIETSISGLYPYIIQKKSNKDLHYFTNFTDKQFQYITSKPIYFTSLSIATIECNGSSLIYNESPIYTKTQNYNNPTILPKQKFQTILLKKLKSCKISYKDNLLTISTDKTTWIFNKQINWDLKTNLLDKLEIK